ncbi:MAG: TRAP transporter substrate-binding protein DctP, partial [Acetobacteraceae bacterium]|nr:TRAP transporter substrate-binding protein DctP [Acetobacteraceae bacterium]
RPFEAGELVPALQVLDTVQSGTVECGHSASLYYTDYDPTFAFGSTLPFGFNTRQQQAWMLQAGALDLMNEFLQDFNVISIIAGNTGAQMGGWFRHELNSAEDIKGLKFRTSGLTRLVIARMGGLPQQLAAPDILPALEKGQIDAAAWVGPYDDEKLGFYKVAKYYYYPGWWAGNAQGSLYVNRQQWEALPPAYQSILQTACADANTWMQSKYDAENPQALRRLIAKGAELRPFPHDLMEAAYKASFEVYDVLAARNANFAKLYGSWKKFREEQNWWFHVAETSFQDFVYTESAAEARKG